MNDKNNNSFVYKILSILLVFILIIFTFISKVYSYTYSENELFEKMMLDADSKFDWNLAGFLLLENSDDTYSVYAYDYKSCVFSFNDLNTLFITFNLKTRVYVYNYNSEGVYLNQSNFQQYGGTLKTLTQYNIAQYLCCNIELYDSNGNVVKPAESVDVPKYTYSITMSTTDETSSPIIAYSNYFDYSDVNNYEVYISLDGENWTLMNYETLTDNNITSFRFNYEITSNGLYYFKFVDKLKNNDYYLSYNVSNIVNVFDKINEQTGAIKEQTEVIKEQTEVNKNIFERLGDLVSFLNPFSENFFVYKLIELLGNLIKDLFVPSDEFLSQWFTDISDYFEDAFGILYYPVDLVIQVLGRFSDISGQEPVISFGNFTLFGAVLVPSFSYNFNDLLTNDTFKMIHDFYLITIDVILWLGLLVYCKNVCANIFGGKFTDDVIDEIQDPRWI